MVIPVATPAARIGRLPDRPAPPALVAPAARQVEELLNEETVDCSPSVAVQLQDHFATPRDTTDLLARAALTVATARGSDRPLERYVEADAQIAHREAVRARLTARYHRRPQPEMLDLEAARQPMDTTHVEQARRSRLAQLVTFLTKEVRAICSGWLNRAPAPAPAVADAPAKAGRALTPPRNPVAAPPRPTGHRDQPAPTRQTPGI